MSGVRKRLGLGAARSGALFFFGFWAAVAIFSPFRNVYFKRLGLSGLEIGILSAIAPVMTLVVSPALSMLADRRRWRRQILLVGLLGMAVTLFVFHLPQSFAALLPLVIIQSAVSCPLVPLGNCLIARMTTRYQLDFGKLRLWGSVGFALVSAACGALWEEVGFTPMFFIGGAALLPVAGSALLLDEGPVEKDTTRPPLSVLRQDTGLLAFLGATFLMGLSQSIFVNFNGVYLDNLGATQLLIGGSVALSALSELPTMRSCETVARRWGWPRIIILGCVLMGSSFLGYGLSHNTAILLALGLVRGMGFGLYSIASVRLIDARAPEAWASTLQSLMTAASWGLAPLVSLPLGGWLADRLGYQSIFLGTGITALLAVGVVTLAWISGKLTEKPLLKAASPSVAGIGEPCCAGAAEG
jgi:PPP family 3-phenylpropionic acid transporter